MDGSEIKNEANPAREEPESYSGIYRCIQWCCLVFVLLQVIIVSYVVFGRFILNKTPQWGEETALLCMVWFSLLSAALAMEDDSHIRMSFVDKFFGKKGIKIRNVFFLLINIVFCSLLIVEGIKLSILTIGSIMPGSHLPVPVMYIPVPIAGVFYLYMQVTILIKEVKSWTKTQSP
jgi:TRAP-type C4-dicarboxylate transport system permease small subunit